MVLDGPDDIPACYALIGDVAKVVCVIANELTGAAAEAVEPATEGPNPQLAGGVSYKGQTRLWLKLWGSSGSCSYTGK
jgi:hypothetical protein